MRQDLTVHQCETRKERSTQVATGLSFKAVMFAEYSDPKLGLSINLVVDLGWWENKFPITVRCHSNLVAAKR